MLNLTRRKGDVLSIGDEVAVTVISIDRNNVVLGIQAPDDVDIVREEARLKVRKNDKRKATGDTQGPKA